MVGEKMLSSSLKLVWLIVPLLLVYGIVLLSPKTSNWVFISNFYPWTRSSVVPPPLPPAPPPFYSSSGMFVDSHNQRDSLEALSDDSVVNRSASPPLAVEPAVIQSPVSRCISCLNFFLSLRTKHTPPMRVKSETKTKPSNLQKLEAGLGRARAAIRDAINGRNRTEDPDFVPVGPIYWDANAFHRSYLEMEKQFKVFVYEEGEPPIFHNGPCRSIYAMEGNFIYTMETSRFRTRDPDKAHAFFLPFSVTAMVQFVYVSDSHDWAPMTQTVRDYIGLVARKYHFWNRSSGADHVMLSCHDWGPGLSSSVPHLFENSIRALCNANTSEGFNPAKDVSLPEINLRDATTNHLLGGPSPSKRPILVFFAGGVHGPIRPILLEQWENKDEDVQVHRYLPKGVSYYEMMRKSKFCICPSGYEVASPRMVEALYTGCVPVIMKDHYVAPFSDVLNWKSFSLEVSVKDIPNLKTILTGISQRQYIRLQRRGLQVRKHFELNFPPKRFDVFHMILHSIWLRRLNVHVREVDEL
ncbi:Xylogalacturonan beta-1,3-xylosyltransferase [Bertholletia excelsa]